MKSIEELLLSEKNLQKIVEKIAYEQHAEDQMDDCHAKMGYLYLCMKEAIQQAVNASLEDYDKEIKNLEDENLGFNKPYDAGWYGALSKVRSIINSLKL